MIKAEFVNRYRAATTELLNAADRLANLRDYYDDVNIGGTLEQSDIPATGEGITPAQFIDGVAAAEAAVNAARVTPLQRLRL